MEEASNASRWWIGVTIVPLFTALSLLTVRILTPLFQWAINHQASVPDAVGSTLLLLYFVAGTISTLGVFLVPPTLPISLYFDARSIERTDCPWSPNAVYWGGLGLVQLGVWGGPGPRIGMEGREFIYAFTVPLALYYLYLRHQHVGTP